MEQNIKRVDLDKGGRKVFIEFDQSAASAGGEIVDTSSKITIKKAPHEELSNEFLKLTPHLLFLCDLAKIKATDDDWFNNYTFTDVEEFNGLNVTGIVFSGSGNEYVKLIGTKTTKKDQVVSINSPIISLEDPSVDAYPLLGNFNGIIERIKEEAISFYNKNHIVVSQPSLF